MENKKKKLTTSGIGKKSIKNIEIARTQGKKSVLIDKSKKNFIKKGSSLRTQGASGRFKGTLTKKGANILKSFYKEIKTLDWAFDYFFTEYLQQREVDVNVGIYTLLDQTGN